MSLRKRDSSCGNSSNGGANYKNLDNISSVEHSEEKRRSMLHQISILEEDQNTSKERIRNQKEYEDYLNNQRNYFERDHWQSQEYDLKDDPV